MSPLRGWMTEHGRPGWYSWIVVVLVPIMASVGVLVVALTLNQRSIDRDRAATQRQIQVERAARLTAEQALCEVWILLDDIYAQTPPPTDAGKALARAVANLRVVNNCPPRTKR